MKERNYLLIKLAEEAAEVAQAALKHATKDTRKSRIRLSQEIGDFFAVFTVAVEKQLLDERVANTGSRARYASTQRKLKERE